MTLVRQTSAILLLLLTTLCACKKDKSSYWVFKGVKYTTSTCTLSKLTESPYTGHYGMTAESSASGQPARIVICYANESSVPADGTYSVITDDGLTAPGRAELMIRLTTGAPGSEVVYHSVGGSGTDGVQSTPDSKNNGRITLRGAGITLVNGTDTADLDYLSVNLTQTN